MENTDVKVNDIINGFPEPEGVHKWARNLRVTDIDFPLGPEGKGVRAVNERGTVYAFRYDEFEIVQRAEATTTERVTVDSLRGLRVGDVVVEDNQNSMWMATVVERQVPVKPAEPEFGYGTAYVHSMTHRDVPQERYQGFLSKSGNFYFLSPQGEQRTARPSQFESFHLDEG